MRARLARHHGTATSSQRSAGSTGTMPGGARAGRGGGISVGTPRQSSQRERIGDAYSISNCGVYWKPPRPDRSSYQPAGCFTASPEADSVAGALFVFSSRNTTP